MCIAIYSDFFRDGHIGQMFVRKYYFRYISSTYVTSALDHNSNAMVVYDYPIAPKRK